MAKTYLQTKLTGTAGQVVGFNASGNAEAQNFSGGFSPRILYTAASGLTVTATKGSTVVTASYSGGQYVMNIPEFGTWTTSNGSKTGTVVVSEVTDYDAMIIGTLDETAWAAISQVSAAGQAASYWHVGDCKKIHLQGQMGTLSLNTDLYCYILGFDHNWTEESNGLAHGIDFGTFKTAASSGIDVALVDSYYGSYQSYNGTKYFQMCHWGPSDYGANYGGWYASDMRYDILGSTDTEPTPYGVAKASGAKGADPTTTCATNPVANTLMACLPSDLRAVMKCMVKYTDNTGGGSDTASYVTSGKDYLPLLAEKEIFGSRTYANSAEQNKQAQYAYYSGSNSKVKYRHSSTGSTCYWWERSPFYDDSIGFCYVVTDGDADYSVASGSRGVAPAFRV